MKRRANMEPLPTDLITDIFSRLPAKSVAMFRTLSKHWASKLHSPDFTELFLRRSSNRPRLLFAVERKGEWLFFSSPQPQNPSSSSPSAVTVDYHTKFGGDVSRYICSYASGLIYFPDMWISNVASSPVICNPINGMYVTLPDLARYRKARGFLGFDPIEKQFKALSEGYVFCDQRDHHRILTLGTTGEELTWRSNSIQCPAYDRSLSEGICINGVLYYIADTGCESSCMVVSFDLRSEEFKFIQADCFSEQLHETNERPLVFDPQPTNVMELFLATVRMDRPTNTITLVLVNYKGKLGAIDWKYVANNADGETQIVELCMWVLEDVEKHEWSKHVYTLPETEILDSCDFSVAGVTASGDIVLSMKHVCKPFYVFYFNPERNTLQSVEIQGFGDNLEAPENHGTVYAFVDHVEDLSVYDAKPLKSSISNVKHICSCCNKEAQPTFHYKKAKTTETQETEETTGKLKTEEEEEDNEKKE
ncbi:F-box associated interaction domain [Arabidopsis suecica]|uniref:F-box associated interaction domain n=1 Tax=Arabidopsis suecica TaxID=45249 RepID=A0A8T1ZX77_ARASU|nr:F-box associated interaction domain [Arabidopsis suecica]